MSDPVKILAFSGSTRDGSFNKKLIQVAAEGARAAGAEVTLVELRDLQLPLYDGDLEDRDGLPPGAVELKGLFKSHQGLLISSPEYNGLPSGVLKNAIDWVSRPMEGEATLEPFAGKVAGLVSASPGGLGGLRGLAILRQLLTNLTVLVVPQQQAVSAAHTVFDEAGAMTDEKQRNAVHAISRRVVETAAKLRA